MASVDNILSWLRQNGVTIWLENDQLRYRAPKTDAVLAYINEIRPHKDEIIHALRQSQEGATKSLRLTRQARPAALPLSYAQERLWVLDQLELAGSAYSIVAAAQLSGRLDVAALEAALVELVRRHEVLRTRFV